VAWASQVWGCSQPTGQSTSIISQYFIASCPLIAQGLRSCTQVAGCLVSLSMLSPRLTLLLAIVTPALMGVGTLMGSGLRKLSRQCQEQVLEFLIISFASPRPV
jgi:hypothetical protein